jgi:hypothetical protein
MLIRRASFGVAAVVAALAAAVVGAGPAYPDPNTWVDCEQFPDHPDCELGGKAPGGELVVGPGGEVRCSWEGEEVPCRDDGCAWWGGDGCYYLFLHRNPPTGAVRPGAGYRPSCLGDPPNATRRAVWIPDSQAPGPPMLARVATSRLVLPVPQVQLAPPLPAAQLVGLATWWWISDGVWRARSASVSVPGVTVTAVGRPVASVWGTGDGGEVSCEGPGRPYPGGGGVEVAGPDCGHTYRQSSAGQPGGAYPVTATISWQVSWSGGGMSGTLGPLFSTTTVQVPVAEVQAVIVP